MMSKLTFALFVLVVANVECSALPVKETTTVPPEVPTDALLHITEGIKDVDVQITTGKKELEEAVTGEIKGTDAPASEKYKDEDKDKEGAINMLKDKDEEEAKDVEEGKNEVEDEDECKDKDEGEDKDEVEDEDECKGEDEEELMDECKDEGDDIDEVEDEDKEKDKDKEEALPDSTVKPSVVVTVAPEQATTKSA